MMRHKVPVSDDHLKAIGKVTVYFSLLEQVISTLIWDLINPHEQRLGRTITVKMLFRNKIELLRKLCRYRLKDERLDEFKELLTRCSAAATERNKIMHSLWGSDPKKGYVRRIEETAKRDDSTSMKPEDIEQIAVLIDQVYSEAINLVFKTGQ